MGTTRLKRSSCNGCKALYSENYKYKCKLKFTIKQEKMFTGKYFGPKPATTCYKPLNRQDLKICQRLKVYKKPPLST